MKISKSVYPHLFAVGVFLLVSIIFCGTEGFQKTMMLSQQDITGWKGMSHQATVYREMHGHYPLWITNMFGGMPAYQVAMEGYWSPLSIIDKLFQLYLPQPINFFFLACISFYFMCLCFRIRPLAAVLGALAFAYCSYSPIIITAGHVTKMLALCYVPAVMGSVYLIFQRKYLIGFSLTALFMTLQIAQGHQQVSYYMLFILLAMGISFAVISLVKKEWGHVFTSSGLVIVAGILGIAANFLVLYTAFDFANDSKRGGQLVMNSDKNTTEKIVNGKTTGLSKDYAFMWSYGKGESWSLMIPGVMGYGLHQASREGENFIFPEIKNNGPLVSYVEENLPGVSADQVAGQMAGALYWGDQPFTNGPVYLGAIICFLFVLGMFLVDNKHKWWITACCVFAMMLAWGNHFPSFNYFMFDHFPFYNKFRVPTMALIIPQVLFALMASLTLDTIIDPEKQYSFKDLKLPFIATGIVMGCAFLFYTSADFSKENRERTSAFNTIVKSGAPNMQEKIQALDGDIKYKPEVDNQVYENIFSAVANQPDPQKAASGFISALRKERAGLFSSDMLSSFMLILVAGILIFLFVQRKINTMVLIITLIVLSAGDVFLFGKKYLNSYSYTAKESFEDEEFPKSTADNVILQDKDPNFRVWNTQSMEESRTSYYHKSIGGYHPAKLGIYDDLIAYQFKGRPNFSVINMLNAKYFIIPEGNDKMYQRNPNALGNCWLVKEVKWVNGPAEEMKAISLPEEGKTVASEVFNPKQTAVIDQKFKSAITNFSPADSADNIKMTQFDNDAITYESNTQGSRLAVFSEIYYKDWNAYVDGKKMPIAKANYVLRAMIIPAGNHKIEYKFEPQSFFVGRKVSGIASWLVLLLLLGGVIAQWRFSKEQPKEVKSAT